MKLNRCSKGHYYDADASSVCPFCAAATPVYPPLGAAARSNPVPDTHIAPSLLSKGTPEFCGRGSSGVVYRLVPKPAEYVAKVVRCESAAAEAAVQHELIMGQCVRSLKGLVHIEDAISQREGDVTYWSILERAYFPLPERMQLAPLSETEVLSLGLQLCDTLLALLDRDILHMDLQPKNIFLDKNGEWLLGDLGSLYTLHDLNKPKRIGTPAFMAPEVYRDGACSEKSAVYSLAMVLYSVLHRGALPLEDLYPAETALRMRLDGTDFFSRTQDVRGLQYLVPALRVDPAARPGLAVYRSLLADCLAQGDIGLSVPFADAGPALSPEYDSIPAPGTDGQSSSFFTPAGTEPWQASSGFSAPGSRRDTLSPVFEASSGALWDDFCEGSSSPSTGDDPFWGGIEEGMPATAPSAPDPIWDFEGMDTFDSSPMSAVSWDEDFGAIETSMPQPAPPAPAPGGIGGMSSRPSWLDREDAAPAAPRPAAPMPPAPPRPAPPPMESPAPPAPATEKKRGSFFDRLFGGKKENTPNASPVQSAPAPTPKPLPRLSEVQFSAVFPSRFVKGEYAILEMFLYEEEYHRVVEQAIAAAETAVKESRSGILQITEKADVCVLLECADQSVEIDGSGEHQTWYGKYLKFDFSVFLPEAYAKRQVMFTATVFFNGVPASKLRFTAQCNTLREQKLELMREDILTAFVSYASQDRSRVATIIQGMKKARPDMDIFFDVEALRSGMDWEKEVRAEIERRDILFLCWSRAARESQWVDREWRYAMSSKGISCIEPIPIDPPDRCPPPAELSSKCFRDRELLYIKNDT